MDRPLSPALAANDTRAVAAWADDGRVRYRLYG
jgi:hypothetical protein